jgi:hypothetical protein
VRLSSTTCRRTRSARHSPRVFASCVYARLRRQIESQVMLNMEVEETGSEDEDVSVRKQRFPTAARFAKRRRMPARDPALTASPPLPTYGGVEEGEISACYTAFATASPAALRCVPALVPRAISSASCECAMGMGSHRASRLRDHFALVPAMGVRTRAPWAALPDSRSCGKWRSTACIPIDTRVRVPLMPTEAMPCCEDL